MTDVLEDQFCRPHEVRAMPRLFAVAACLIAAAVLSGCQCCPGTAKYGDLIDDVSDQPYRLDCLYNPTLDLNRIGRPDWCRSPFNRLWCSFGCRGACCSRCSEQTAVQFQPRQAEWAQEQGAGE